MDDAQLAKRFDLIEQQLRTLSEHLGISCPPFAGDGASAGAPAVPDEVVALAQAGKETEAVSLLRQLTGATRLEAKRTVDSL